MHNIRILQLFLYIYLIKVNCEYTPNENVKNKKFIPYFRRQVEEIEDKNVSEPIEKDDNSNFVSFIVKNVKEIFNDDVDKPENKQINMNATITSTEITTTTSKPNTFTYGPEPFTFISTIGLRRPTFNATETTATLVAMYPTRTDVILYENLTLTTLIEDEPTLPGLYGINEKPSKSPDMIVQDTALKADKNDLKFDAISRAFPSSFFSANNLSEAELEQDPRRSCIMCNNIETEDCNDPKNKLIQSIMCEREDDMCYSMHTPFGIIDRGCFNSNHNLTTYVCSCNLCNHISISEMPYMFSKKPDWVENVIEISRTRHFRRSIFKDMSCLKCEVNTTQQQGDILDSANCLEGHIGSVPVAQCEHNEVCAVKALRADGYIWRGCLKLPLYNYWWTICDYDLCNFDSIISLYDFV